MELSYLQLSFFAHSPLRRFLDTLSHCKQRSSIVSENARTVIRADYWDGDATKHFSVKKWVFFSEEGRGNSVTRGFSKDFCRKGNSVKRFGPFTEPPDSEN